MMELIIAIAALCNMSIHNGRTNTTDSYQLECQKYYIDCVKIGIIGDSHPSDLIKCIKKRKLK